MCAVRVLDQVFLMRGPISDLLPPEQFEKQITDTADHIIQEWNVLRQNTSHSAVDRFDYHMRQAQGRLIDTHFQISVRYHMDRPWNRFKAEQQYLLVERMSGVLM